MQLGWIDFSKNERDKVLSVLDLINEPGVLDELGISSVRDAYSDLFFPGTSTIQTRAKYFFIVPYALRDLEFVKEKDYTRLKRIFDNTEEKCAHILYNNDSSEYGIIGRRSILNKTWVQRSPANIYWAGLRRYQIFHGKMSIDQYIKIISIQKQDKSDILSLGNRDDESEEDMDDKNAGVNRKLRLLNMPTYERDWINNFDMNLTEEEGAFLKNQIISTCENSIMAHILKKNMHEILEYSSFEELEQIMSKFPKDIQDNYRDAKAFSEFIFVLRVIYNLIVSEDGNISAKDNLKELQPKFNEISQVDINKIFKSLRIYNPFLKSFLIESKKLMKDDDIGALKELIKNREISLKGRNRSKTCHPGEFDKNLWFAGGKLDYRFNNAKNIIRDIFASEGIIEKDLENESNQTNMDEGGY